jgi:putative membrane protein
MKLLIRAAINAAIVWFTFQVIDGLTFGGDWVALVLVVALLAFANAFIRPILKLLALPIRMVTLGIATLIINVAVVVGVIWLAGQLGLGVTSDGWVPMILGALVITVLTSIVSSIIKD